MLYGHLHWFTLEMNTALGKEQHINPALSISAPVAALQMCETYNKLLFEITLALTGS